MRYIILMLLLLPTLVLGQDSLVIEPVGRFDCAAVFPVDGEVMLGQVIEPGDYYPLASSYAALFDVSYPNRPREIMRCMPVMWEGWDDIHQWPGVIREAVLYDSLIIALRMRYSRSDINSCDFWAWVAAAPVRTGEIMAQQYYESVADSFPAHWEDPMPNGMGLLGHYLVVGMGRLGIYIFDLAQDNFLEEVAHIELNCGDICVSGDRLIAIQCDGYVEEYLIVYDVTDPTQPEEVGRMDIRETPVGDLTVVDDYLYAAPFTYDDLSHLAIIDIGSDDAPDIVADIDSLSPCSGRYSAAYGSILFLRDRDYVAVYDISEPLNPQQLISHQFPDYGGWHKINALGKYFYLSYYYDNRSITHTYVFYFGPDEAPTLGNSTGAEFTLHPVYPNPFNDKTVMTYNLSKPGFVNLSVFSPAGRQILNRQFFNSSGQGKWVFDGTGLVTGNYFIVLENEGQTLTRSALLLR